MPKDQFFKDKFRRPELFLSELLRKSAQGRFHEVDENVPFLYRAAVIAVDVEGGKLQNPGGSGKVTHTFNGKSIDVPAIDGPENPKNSIKGRIMTEGFDQFFSDDDLRVFWPFFPEHNGLPIKPGEHVYVLFEDADFQHGLWISKVPGHEGANFVRGEKQFEKASAGSKTEMFPDSAGTKKDDTDQLNTDQGAGEGQTGDDRLKKLFGDS